MWKKWISTLLLVSLLVPGTATQSWSESKPKKVIQLSFSSARIMLADLKYYREGKLACEKKSGFIVNSDKACDQIEQKYEFKVKGLEQDKAEGFKEAGRYKELYVESDAARAKAEADAPSRVVWGSIGLVVGIVLSFVAVIAVK